MAASLSLSISKRINDYQYLDVIQKQGIAFEQDRVGYLGWQSIQTVYQNCMKGVEERIVPVKEFQVDFTPQVGKKGEKEKEKEKEKVKPDFKKKRPITGKVQAIVESSKSMLERMMKTNKPIAKQKSEYLEEIVKPPKAGRKGSALEEQIKHEEIRQMSTETFLKTQKQKQKQYAKELQSRFQSEKKERMSKLYERQKEANEKISSQKVETKNQHRLYDQLPVLIRYPVDEPNEFILQTHQKLKIKEFISFINVEELRENDKKSLGGQDKWEMMEKLCEDSSKLKLVNIKDDQVRMQNELVVYPGNDNLMSVLALIALKPQLLQKLTLYQQKMLVSKVYPFLFYNNNQKVTVLVDNYLQSQESEFGSVQVYSHFNNKNVFLASLFEKAYRKLFKSIGTLHEVCNNVLGVYPEVIKIASNAVIQENVFEVLRFYIRNGGLVGVMRKGDMKGANSYEGRVYSVKEVRVGKKQEECSMQVINPYYGKSLLNEGREHLDLKQILKHFNRIVLVKDYPASFVGIEVNIHMYSFGIPASNNPEWVKNHQYLINVNKSSIFRVILKATHPYPQIFGFSLVRCEPHDTKITAINLDKLVTTVRSTLLNQSCFTGYLQKGSYMLLPFTHQRSQGSYVFLKLEIFTNNPDNLTWGKSKIVDVEYKEIGRTNDKIEGDFEVTEKYERPKAKPLLEKGEKHYLPDLLEVKDIPAVAIQNPQYKAEDILIPGLLHRLIVRDNVFIDEKPIQKEKASADPPQQNPQMSYQNRNEELKVLLGIDAYTEEVDKEMFEEALEHLEEQVDLRDYGLGDQGFEKIIEYVLEQPRIVVLNLRGNQLSDKSIVLLCYFLQKSDHGELRKLDLSENKIGSMGFRALQGLTKRIKLKEVLLSQNSGLKVHEIKSLSNL